MSDQRSLQSPATFFSVVGSQDPQLTPGGLQGPGLDLLAALMEAGYGISEVLLIWTPQAHNKNWPGGYDAQRTAMVNEIGSRWPELRVVALPLKVERPNSTAELVPVMAKLLERFRHAGRLHVNTSSGTPQMLEALKVLRGTGWFAGGNVTLWQIDRPEYRHPEKAYFHEATTPFLEEALKLATAFSALRRFDFAGAENAFNNLAHGQLELPDRQSSVRTLAEVSRALWWLDARDFKEAGKVLGALEQHVPPLVPLRELLAEGAGHGTDALVWLTWGRYDRAYAQERVADALLWAVILHELMVVKLLEHFGIDSTKKQLRPADLAAGLFDKLVLEVPQLAPTGRRELKVMGVKDWLQLLQAPALLGSKANIFDANTNSALDKVRSQRNKVAHQGITPDETDLEQLNQVVNELLAAFPFQANWAAAWVKQPDLAPISAAALQQLITELQGWMG